MFQGEAVTGAILVPIEQLSSSHSCIGHVAGAYHDVPGKANSP